MQADERRMGLSSDATKFSIGKAGICEVKQVTGAGSEAALRMVPG